MILAMNVELRPAPPKINARPAPILIVAVVLIMAVLGSGVVLFFFDPARNAIYPVCLFHELTGWNCPGCGGTRAAYQLLHGHLLHALRDNALFVLVLAVLAVWGVWGLIRRIRKQPATCNVPARVWWGFLVIVLLFTVLRNLPGFAWLSP